MGIRSQYPHSPGATLIPDDLAYLDALLFARTSGLSPLVPPVTPFLVTGPATLTLMQSQRLVLVDTTAGPVILTLPVPLVNSMWIIKDSTGKSAINPITVKAPTLWALENPSNPGAQVAQGLIASQGASVWYMSFASLSQFVELV